MSRNLTMMTDLYELTMMYGYFKEGKHNDKAVFDLFFRRQVGHSAYAIMAGLEQVIDYINDIHFSEDDIAYLRSLGLFGEDFLDYLKDFRFHGELYAATEGSIVFPGEPIVRVKAGIAEAQLLETTMLNIINHQTLIATKASRICAAAKGGTVMEFGLRRAQGPDAGTLGARAAIIGGCASTSNVLAAQMFGATPSGTHAHSWIMSFESELEAFRSYAKVFPDACVLLVDTYDVLNSGIPNAITVFNELREQGHEPIGIRIDSGDLAYLSKKARKMLDEAGYENAKIVASGDLDENLLLDLYLQGAKIDSWGIGTKLITSEDYPALGGVYKLSAIEIGGKMYPRLKLSENVWKITNPGYKKVKRIYSKFEHKAIADLIMLDEEELDETKPLTIFNPNAVWEHMTIENFYTEDVLKPIFIDGKQVYEKPTLAEIRKHAEDEMDTLWDEYKRFTNPHVYKVDLSQKLYDMKTELLHQWKKDKN
ncbi:MAG: nicotinate phosphoribosyltransferase [Clostridia bacterium]|nr:nicotinate phosphoribosyltransferase [Clostridia bacterium]